MEAKEINMDKDNDLEIISKLAKKPKENKKYYSDYSNLTDNTLKIIKKIGETEVDIRKRKKELMMTTLEKHNDRLESGLRIVEVEQDQLIQQLSDLLRGDIEFDLVIQEFIKVFHYNWEDEENLKFTKKLRFSADEILRKCSGYEDKAFLELATTVAQIHSVLNEKDDAYFHFNENALPMIESLERSGKLTTIEATEYYFRVFDHICGMKHDLVSSMQIWAEQHPIESQRTFWKATVYTCSACRCLKRNLLSDAKSYIETAHENINRYKSEKEFDKLLYSERQAYYYLMCGIYFYKMDYYDEAKSNLLEYMQYSHGAMSSYSRGYASYLLYKIYEAAGDKINAKIQYDSSKNALEKTIKRDFCMFNYREVIEDLKNASF